MQVVKKIAMQISHATLNWSSLEKTLFRFFFIYFALFILIQNNGAYPFWGYVMEYPTGWLHTLIPWVGKNILRLSYDITVFTNGSGDTTYDYVIVFSIFLVAVISTLGWSVLDRNRANYQNLYYWLTVAIRFYLGLMLISYGLVKVFKLQFPFPGLYRLTEAYGDSSPMGLAWAFLGFSKGYNLFMGIAEVLAVLLLFRRTMTVGAIITLMAASNVMAVNYFYDVPVKILSTHLVLMTLFLLLHNAKELLSFFFTGQQIQLSLIEAPQFSNRWIRISGIVFKVLLLGFSLGYGSIQASEAMKQYGDEVPKGKFYGMYNVERFVYNQSTLAPLVTDTIRWRQMVLEFETYARVRMMNDSINAYRVKIDTTTNSMQFSHNTDVLWRFDFVYRIPDKDRLELKGTFKGDSVSIYFNKSKVASGDFRLIRRGFHWVNEYPYNR
jgi:hypothetical protein